MMSRLRLPLRRGTASQGEDWDDQEFFGVGVALREEFIPARRPRNEEENRETPRRRAAARFEERARIFGQAPPDQD